MLGYSTQSKRYKIWDTESRVLVISRDVRFDESPLGSCTTTIDDSIEGSSSVDDQVGDVREKLPHETDPLNPKTGLELDESSFEEFQDTNS